MKKRRLKKGVIYSLYACCFLFLLSIFYFIDRPKLDHKLSANPIISDDKIEINYPVINIEPTIIKPFINKNVTIARYFYDYKSDEEIQKKSIINYKNTFIPNSGVDFKEKKEFDVVSILDGKVTRISNDNLLGKIIEITYSNNLIGIYQSVDNIIIKEGDNVLQGQIIAKSGLSNISKDLGNHLHFELVKDNENVNPLNYFDKKLSDI